MKNMQNSTDDAQIKFLLSRKYTIFVTDEIKYKNYESINLKNHI